MVNILVSLSGLQLPVNDPKLYCGSNTAEMDCLLCPVVWGTCLVSRLLPSLQKCSSSLSMLCRPSPRADIFLKVSCLWWWGAGFWRTCRRLGFCHSHSDGRWAGNNLCKISSQQQPCSWRRRGFGLTKGSLCCLWIFLSISWWALFEWGFWQGREWGSSEAHRCLGINIDLLSSLMVILNFNISAYFPERESAVFRLKLIYCSYSHI